MNTPEWEALRAFRQQVYTLFGCRRDALFEVLSAYERALTLDPNNTTAWLGKSTALHNLKRPAEALSAYEQALIPSLHQYL
jgi:Flp pilus assembly protein TadD